MAETETGVINPPLKPLFWGRTLRILAGLVALYFGFQAWGRTLAGHVGTVLLALLGVSFVAGGLLGNPGCETTALLNLILPQGKRVYHF